MYDPNTDPLSNVKVERDGMTFNIVRQDPPFYRIQTTFELPKTYQGEYTSIQFAKNAINEYCEKQKEVLCQLMEEMAAEKPKKVKKVA